MRASNRTPLGLADSSQNTFPTLRPWRALAVTGLAVALAGCVTTRTVDKTILAPDVQDATLDALIGKMAAEYEPVKTLQMKVTINATKSSARKGEEKDYPSFPGIILLRKPSDLRVIMELPVVGSRALDLDANGKTFQLLLSAPKCKMMTGSEEVTKPSENVLENLRPPVIRDALAIPPVQPGEFVTLTQNSRLVSAAHGRKAAVVEPDYDVSVLRGKTAATAYHVLDRVRVIHISRVNLLPYEQDLYDEKGRIQETISYSKYQKFGDIDYPMSIIINRPLDEYTLRLSISKLVLNPALDDEQFKLVLPEGCPVQNL